MKRLTIAAFGLATALGLAKPGVAETPIRPAAAREESAADRAWQILRDGVNDKQFATRISALSALGDAGPNVRGAHLAEGALHDKDPDIRAQAATTLGAMKYRPAIQALRIALSDPAPQVSFAAARSLWQLGDFTGRRVLLEVLEGEKKTSDGFVDGNIRGMHRKLKDKKGLVVMGAERGAGELMGPLSFGMPLIKQQIEGSADSARASSVALLASRPDRETLQALKAALMDRDWKVRTAAAQAIGKLARPGTIQWLEYSLDDGKAIVRYEAAAGILRLTSGRTANFAKSTEPK